jgi:hypothetical protein
MNAPQVAPFDSEAGFGKAIDIVILAARDDICVFDRDLSRLPLDNPQRSEALREFLRARPGHRLRIALHDTLRLQNRSPRLQALLRNFGHAIEVRRVPEELRHVAECYLLAGDAYGAVRFHADHPRGKLVCGDPAELRPYIERFRQIWEAAIPCTLGSPLGL